MIRRTGNSGFILKVIVRHFIGLIILMASSCNCIKYLKPGQDLYSGADIRISTKDQFNTKPVKRQLEKVLKPKPNQTILGIRFKLWFYLSAGDDPKKKLRKWIKFK